MSAFPEALDEDERVLFRLESERRTGGFNLLVQSQGLPDWTWLTDTEQTGYLLPVDALNPWVKSFDPDLLSGQLLVFRILANPTVKKNGKRRGLCREEDQRAWMIRKADRGGFRVHSLRLRERGWIQGALFRKANRHNLCLFAVQFDGLLEVMDTSKFKLCLERGIGSGKGLGCGLLSIAQAGS